MTDELQPSAGLSSTTHEAQAVLPSEAEQPRVFLVLYHAGDARAWELTEGVPSIVGRQWPANVVIDDPQLSRQHAQFTWSQGRLVVEDLASRNGTLVRGAKVKTAQLQMGEQALMGTVIASVHASSPTNFLAHRIESYDGFGSRLNIELSRARSRAECVILLAVRATGEERAHGHCWWSRLYESLRPTDTVAMLNRECLLVMQTALAEDDGLRTAKHIVRCSAGSLVCGVASFPQCGSSSEELLTVALEAARRATPAHPLMLAARAGEPVDAHLIATNPKLRAVHELVERVAKTDAPVLILGETGSGKEVLANLIHRKSPRATHPHVAINCGAIPAGLLESALFGHVKGAFTGAHQPMRGVFEQAHLGTIFLDELGELSPSAQTALLRVLDTRRFMPVGSSRTILVDVRIVAATSRDLERMVDAGEFRRDLWYRLNTVTVEVPPLRERLEDIAALAALFIEQASVRWLLPDRAIDENALRSLMNYDWPGNVRELRNVMERALLVGTAPAVALEDLPVRIRSFRGQPAKTPTVPTQAATPLEEGADHGVALSKRMQEYEAVLIGDALDRASGNVAQAASQLGMSQRTLTRKLSRYKLARR